MYPYILRRLTLLCLSLFLVSTFTFILMKVIPGNPFAQEQAIPEEVLRTLYAHYGLDQPLYLQYFRYLKSLITFDFGVSLIYEGRTTNDIIREGFPISATIGFLSLCISCTFGILLGSIGAFFRSKWQDTLAMAFAVIGVSVPSFIFATFLQYAFAIKIPLFPIARCESWRHFILPCLALAAFPTAFIARLTRSKMVEILEKDYVLTALAKGLSWPTIILRHVLKNSLLPVISYLGSLSASIITGSFIVEKIFGIPGLGGWFVTSIANRDYTIIMGLTIFYSVLIGIMVFLTDCFYVLFDPRIKGDNYV